jgi:hypothetical protein
MLKDYSDLKEIQLSSSSTKKFRIKEFDLINECFRGRESDNKVVNINNYQIKSKASKSAQGIVYFIYKKDSDEKIAVLKQAPFTIKETESDSGNIIHTESLIEIIISGLTNILIDNKVSPNFVYRTKLFICDDCDSDLFEPSEDIGYSDLLSNYGDIKDFLNEKSCIYTLSEYVRGDTLSSIIANLDSDKTLLDYYTFTKSILLQILISIYTYQTFFGIVHSDLHSGNILIEATDRDRDNSEYICYKLDDKMQFYVPANSIVKIIDFGRGKIQNKLEPIVNIKGVDLYKAPIYALPETKADQRRVAIFFLNYYLNKFYDGSIYKQSSSDINPTIPCYFDQQVKNNIYLHTEYIFTKHARFKIQDIISFNKPNPLFKQEHIDILQIIDRMIKGDEIINILKDNFKDFAKYDKKKQMIIETYDTNKTIDDLTITNTSILKYINPLVDSVQFKNSESSQTLADLTDDTTDITGENTNTSKIRWKFWKK